MGKRRARGAAGDRDLLWVFTGVRAGGDFDLLSERLINRKGHYMDPNLLQSQLDTLEAPDEGLVLDISRTPAEIAEKTVELLDLR